jgi:hypothetical protein
MFAWKNVPSFLKPRHHAFDLQAGIHLCRYRCDSRDADRRAWWRSPWTPLAIVHCRDHFEFVGVRDSSTGIPCICGRLAHVPGDGGHWLVYSGDCSHSDGWRIKWHTCQRAKNFTSS